jgi:fatty acid desaturase
MLQPTTVWRDLVALGRWEATMELLLPLPWLAGSLLLAAYGLYLAALPLSFVFFLTGLRLNHGGCHYAIGLRRHATDIVLLVLSVLMLGSMHAVQWNHLRHHRHCLAADDIEAMGARRSGLGAILLGPWFPLRLHQAALRGAAPSTRRWIVAELAANLLWLPLLIGPLALGLWRYHVLAMALGQSLTAFFAVWTVHHDCPPGVVARTIRSRIKSAITFDMFYHLEHHLYPAVPTAHLHLLAARLGAARRGRAGHAAVGGVVAASLA